MRNVIKIHTSQGLDTVKDIGILTNKKKVLFIILTNLRTHGNAGNYQDFPYGILSIIEHNKNFAKFEILDLIIDDSCNGDWLNVVDKTVKKFTPEIVGLSVMFDNAYHGISPIAEKLKKLNHNLIIVAGGPAISPAAKDVIKFQPNLDAICFSEGERPMEALLLSENMNNCLQEHPSWITLSKSTDSFLPQKTLLKNLDNVANINFGLLETNLYKAQASFNPLLNNNNRLNLFPIVTSRGCPFKCSFCWHSGENDTSMRYASVDSVIAHIENIVVNYGANAISIYDDMLLLPIKRAKELFRRLEIFKLRIELPNGLSPTYIDEELVKLMYLAGVRSVRLAIESGDEFILHKVINKPLRVHMVKPVVEMLRKFDIWVVGFFVIGMPGENNQHRQSTIDLIRDVGIDLSSISVASPSKGSLLYEQCIENGYIPNPAEAFLKSGYLPGEGVINTPEFSAEYISNVAYLMNLEVNFVYNNRIRMGQIDVAKKYFLYIIKTYPFHAFAHYFLAMILKKNGQISKSEKHLIKVAEICKDDPKWLEYFNHFQINPYLCDYKFLETSVQLNTESLMA